MDDDAIKLAIRFPGPTAKQVRMLRQLKLPDETIAKLRTVRDGDVAIIVLLADKQRRRREGKGKAEKKRRRTLKRIAKQLDTLASS